MRVEQRPRGPCRRGRRDPIPGAPVSLAIHTRLKERTVVHLGNAPHHAALDTLVYTYRMHLVLQVTAPIVCIAERQSGGLGLDTVTGRRASRGAKSMSFPARQVREFNV